VVNQPAAFFSQLTVQIRQKRAAESVGAHGACNVPVMQRAEQSRCTGCISATVAAERAKWKVAAVAGYTIHSWPARRRGKPKSGERRDHRAIKSENGHCHFLRKRKEAQKREREREDTSGIVVKKQSVTRHSARVLYTGWLLCQKEDERDDICVLGDPF
jgi:hypothetical protein